MNAAASTSADQPDQDVPAQQHVGTEHRLANLTWTQAGEAAHSGQLVIIPTGAIEAHGPHLPLDVDTHTVETIALLLARRTGALMAPVIAYGYSTTFSKFPGTISLSAETYQQVVFEVCCALVDSGFHRLLILNGNRPNGTSNDVAARRIADAYPDLRSLQVSALSYWEPAAEAIHAIRRSPIGGMGHGCEFETSVQLALRPELVRLSELAGIRSPLVAWDLVGPTTPARTYGPQPDPTAGHPGIFGDPFAASSEAGSTFVDLVVDALADELRSLRGSYQPRGSASPALSEDPAENHS